MASQSLETGDASLHSSSLFGRRNRASHAGSDPQESDLLSWALQKGVLPVLAQASLCMNQVYAPCSRRRVLFVPGLPIVQQGS